MNEGLRATYCVGPETRLLDVMDRIDRNAKGFVIVVDDVGCLLGIITDGDVRRALLSGMSLGQPAQGVMNSSPVSVGANASAAERRALMRRRSIRQLPVVDHDGVVREIVFFDRVIDVDDRPNWAVLMAGGLGLRLRPLTEDRPKPMVEVAGRPMLEHLIDQCRAAGLRRFFLSVNYKKEVIQSHFGDGSRFGCDIRYIEEPERLGTAGSLGLLPERAENPVLVANGDVLSGLDFGAFLDAHAASGATATMAIREHLNTIPFGVVSQEDGLITRIDEKPTYSFFVAAGVYALSPAVIDLVPRLRYFEMPDLFRALIDLGMLARSYKIEEYWFDMGSHGELKAAEAFILNAKLV